jgi:predicted phosphodiesterase
MKFNSSRSLWSKLPLFGGGVLMASALSLPAFAQTETMFFASDVHNKRTDLQSLINAHNSCELYALVGDYNSNDPYTFASTTSDLDALIALMPSGANKIAVEGNHDDQNDVHYPASPADGGEMVLFGNTFYDVYTINYDTYIGTNARLIEYLASHTGKLVFILGHYPLHSMRDANYAAEATAIFNTLQNYGNQMDLVYVWGHNHRDSDLDMSVRTMAVPGDIIRNGPTNSGLNTSVTETPIVFTYMRAGYVKPIPGANAQATVVSLSRYGLTMERYEKNNSSAIEYGYVPRCGDGVCKPGTGENACNCFSDCGNPYASGSCYAPLSCGGQSPGGCYCDSLCEVYNDCCFDKLAVCGCDTP